MAVIVNAEIAGTRATFTCQNIEQDPIDANKVRLTGLQIVVDQVFSFQVLCIPKSDVYYYGYGQQLPSSEEVEAERKRAAELANAAKKKATEEKPESQGNGNKKPRAEAKAESAEE